MLVHLNKLLIFLKLLTENKWVGTVVYRKYLKMYFLYTVIIGSMWVGTPNSIILNS